ncbi:MAG: ABC transporter substrate-binding protein [Alphaproteobacteria bacterium]|nr:ABC transporter substrate-binding protein [Alphaproteobacteria bacterium]
MRRRDVMAGLLLASAAPRVWAQARPNRHRIAIIRPAGPVSLISATGIRFYRAFFAELRQLGDVEGQNLTVERYSGEGRPEGYADLGRKVVNGKPDVIVAITPPIMQAVRAATSTIPILFTSGDPIRSGLVTNLAHPGGNITGITVQTGMEVDAKRLEILKEVVPSASTVAALYMRLFWQEDGPPLLEVSRRLHISLVGMLLEQSTPAEFQRLFAEIARDRPDAIIVQSDAALTAYHPLIVELVNKSRLPAAYAWPEYPEAGGLMSYGADLGEVGRRMADDVHQVLNGVKPGDIPIYQPTKYEFAVNLKTAKAQGVAVPPSLLAAADEVIE